jgi:hypothetical protein
VLLVWVVALTSLLNKTRQSSGCDLIVLILNSEYSPKRDNPARIKSMDSISIKKGKTGQTHLFWGGNFCDTVTQFFLVCVLQKFALTFFLKTPLRL